MDDIQNTNTNNIQNKNHDVNHDFRDRFIHILLFSMTVIGVYYVLTYQAFKAIFIFSLYLFLDRIYLRYKRKRAYSNIPDPGGP